MLVNELLNEQIMDQQTKVLLLIPHLGGGGAEKVMALLARQLSSHKYELHLGVVSGSEPLPQSDFPNLKLHMLRAPRVRSAAFRILTLVRRIKPHVLLSGMFHLNFMVLLLRPLFPRSTRVLIRQNGFVSASLAFDRLPASTRLFYRLLYPRANRVICQTQAMADDLVQTLKLNPNRMVVLHNPIDVDALRASQEHGSDRWTSDNRTGSGPHLLAIGRLSSEKGFDLLLEAFASVQQHFPEARLIVAGAGLEETRLKAQCSNLGLAHTVTFPGRVENLSVYFADATLFVLSSRHEGMPNALLEAAACDLPIVALPAAGGVADLLRNQPGVWLANEISSTALAATLLQALTAFQPGQRYTHAFLEPFKMPHAIQAYEQLIDAMIHERQP